MLCLALGHRASAHAPLAGPRWSRPRARQGTAVSTSSSGRCSPRRRLLQAPPAPSAPHRPAAPCAPLPPDASVCVCRNATLLLAASGRRARLGAAALSHQDGKRVAVALGRGGLPLLAGHAKLQERVTLTARIESHVAPAKLTRHSSALGVECILALRHGFLF